MGRDILSVIPFISLIVVAVIRLLPSFSSLASAFTYIKVYRNSFDTVINEIYDSKANLYVSDKKIINVDNNLDNKKLISLENISFNYPGSQKGTKSISNIKLNINKGSMTGILGKSGSGKST